MEKEVPLVEGCATEFSRTTGPELGPIGGPQVDGQLLAERGVLEGERRPRLQGCPEGGEKG